MTSHIKGSIPITSMQNIPIPIYHLSSCWDNHIDSIAKKAQQRLYFLHQLRKFYLPQELLKQFYSAIIESVLCSSITVWFGSATKTDIRRLQRTVRTPERIIGDKLNSPPPIDLVFFRKKINQNNLVFGLK